MNKSETKPLEKASSKTEQRMICIECFKIIIPNLKNVVYFGDEDGYDTICHAPPCGDGLNEDQSVLISIDENKEQICEYANDRINFLKDLSNDGWQEVQFIMNKIFKIKYVLDWHRFLAVKGYPKYKKIYNKKDIQKWKRKLRFKNRCENANQNK